MINVERFQTLLFAFNAQFPSRTYDCEWATSTAVCATNSSWLFERLTLVANSSKSVIRRDIETTFADREILSVLSVTKSICSPRNHCSRSKRSRRSSTHASFEDHNAQFARLRGSSFVAISHEEISPYLKIRRALLARNYHLRHHCHIRRPRFQRLAIQTPPSTMRTSIPRPTHTP